MRNRCLLVVCSVVFVAWVALPCEASAASIAETKAAIGQGCVASGEYSFAGGMGMRLADTAHRTFVWGSDPFCPSISTPDAFLIFPEGNRGKVGIGTASLSQTLEVDHGNILVQGEDSFDADGEEAFCLLGDSSNYIKARHGTGVIIGTYFKGDALTIMHTSGNVGIGTTTPDYLLEVNGNAAKSSGGTAWSVSSDERLKDITGTYQRGLDAVASLRPVTFHYKQGNPCGLPSNEENIGFIAQEVQEVFPKAVNGGK